MSNDAFRRLGRRLPQLWPLLPVMLLTAVVPCASALRAQSVATISPEEAFAYLQGYSLTAATAPAGFTPGTFGPHTPVIQALGESDPDYAFAQLQRTGLIITGEQTLRRGGGNALTLGVVEMAVFSEVSQGRDFVTGPAHQPRSDDTFTVERIDPGVSLGDDAVAWHLTPVGSGAAAVIAGFEFLWHHGSVVFDTTTLAMPQVLKLADAQAIAAAIEKRVAAAGAMPVHSPGIAPPATEQQRLDHGITLGEVAPTGRMSPKGWDDLDLAFLHPADSVLRTGDTVAALQSVRAVDQHLHHVIASDQSYEASAADDDSTMDVYAFLSADDAAAQLDMNLAGSSDRAITPPVMVGDSTTAYRYTRTQSDGTVLEDVDIYWRHGPLLLNLELIETAGLRSDAEIGALVLQMEKAYQESAIGSPPAPPLDAHASSLEPGSVRVDWINSDDKADGFGIYDPGSGRVIGSAGRSATTFTVDGLRPGTTFCMQVYGYDPAGSSDLSDLACAVVIGGAVPAGRPAATPSVREAEAAAALADPFADTTQRLLALFRGGAMPEGHRAAAAQRRAAAHSIEATGLRLLKAQADETP